MFNFLQSFFSGIPSTRSYDAKLHEHERLYTVYLETLESDDYKRYTELKEYLSHPTKFKNSVAQSEDKLRQSKEKLERFNSTNRQFKSVQQLKKEFKLQHRRKPKLRFLRTKEERAQRSEDNRQLNAAIHQLHEEHRQYRADRERDKQNLLNEVELRKQDIVQLKTEFEQLKQEFKKLQNSKPIKNVFKARRKYSKIFKELERWVLKFYDDFSKPEIDSRWSNKQIVSEKLINGAPYSPIEDLHIFSPDNIQQGGGKLKIRTKQEQKEGLAWDKNYGLVPKVFSYTSGMLTTSHSFNQLYGKFEAKIQVKQSHGTYHAFWMGTTTKIPHLNIFKFENHNLTISVYTNDKTVEQKLKYKLKNESYIYTLLWTNSKLTWLINGKKVYEMPNIINEPMYISISSGVFDKKANPTTMYVDWIRCFRHN
ncbi:MAG: family 16 glycosylhydrolase [Prevotellaceae bacterium]|jgi:hypothetical protein|nr:family 16 glycosylhydrolase [Prevotellaceae bacterium]